MKKSVIFAIANLFLILNGLATSSHLIYHSTLDDDAAIITPVVGESGTRGSGTFVAGVIGNGVQLQPFTQAAKVPFSNGLPIGKGRIEFYGRSDSGRTSFYDYGDPKFFTFCNQDGGRLSDLQFTANDGTGGSGIALCLPGVGVISSRSGYAYSLPYSCVIGDADPTAWHHYAIVWNTNGIANISGNPAVAVLFDDTVILSRSASTVDLAGHVSGMQAIRYLTIDNGRSICSIDEFKVWDTDEIIDPEPIPATPVIKPTSGTIFDDSLTISMTCSSKTATIHYTTDGKAPTLSSPSYTGKFKIYKKTTIKAIAFYDDGTASEMAEAEYVMGVCETPVITAPSTFTGSKAKIVISCATDGAVVRYTTDGSVPNSHSTKYTKPLYATNDITIKAYAMKAEYTQSEIATLEIARQWGIGDTVGAPDHKFETSGSEGFMRVDDDTAKLGESMQSGDIDDDQESVMSTTVVGPGVLTFKWKTSCEATEEHDWDHAEFAVDKKVISKLDGITDWITVSHRIKGQGEHSITWKYKKDDIEYQGSDCLWVSEYEWKSDYTETQTTDVPVPYDWLTAKCREIVNEYDSYERVAKQTAENSRLTVEQCYVAGLDPESRTNDFTSIIKMNSGMPSITWKPNLAEERAYKIWGKQSLDETSEWEYPTNSLHRFFRVTVEMP